MTMWSGIMEKGLIYYASASYAWAKDHQIHPEIIDKLIQGRIAQNNWELTTSSCIFKVTWWFEISIIQKSLLNSCNSIPKYKLSGIRVITSIYFYLDHAT